MIGYIVILKQLLPETIESILQTKMPHFVSTSAVGQLVWASILTFSIILPLSMPRKLSANKYSNTICFFLMIYFVGTIAGLCLYNRTLVPELGPSLRSASFQSKMPLS